MEWYFLLFGLLATMFVSRRDAFRKAKQDGKIPKSQEPDLQENKKQFNKKKLTDRNGKNILDKNGYPIETREYTFTREDGTKIVIQDHQSGHDFGGEEGNIGSHFNVRPNEDTRNGKIEGTEDHYEYE